MGDTRLEPLVLSEDERRTLENWVKRRSTAQGMALRARIELACAQGGSNLPDRVSKRAFGALDAHLWRLAWKWARISHPNKPKRWIIARHFGMFSPARQDKWVFGSRETGFYLRKFAWTAIVRHRMVAGRASPDDPALTGYWDQRRRRTRLPVDPATWHLLRRQRDRCPLCRGLLLHTDHPPQDPGEWQQWHTATRKAIRKHAITSVTGPGTPDERAAHHLIHAHCQRRRLGGTSPAILPGPEPSGLA